MLALIMALCLTGFGAGEVDQQIYRAWFDGDISFVGHTPTDYVIVEIYSTIDNEYELIWTSDHILSGGDYEYFAYSGTFTYIDGFEPFKVTATWYIGNSQSRPRKITVSGLLWDDDFDQDGITDDWYCTNDFDF